MIVENSLLSVFFGSAILGAGVALLYKIEASTGGTTIPPMIFKKYFGIDQSIVLFISDALLLFLIYLFLVLNHFSIQYLLWQFLQW